MKELISDFLKTQKSLLEEIILDHSKIIEFTELLIEARNKGKKIFMMGNGGSGSTASHFTSDLLKTAITKGDKRFQVFSLTDNIPVILAWSNDATYDDIFVEQLKNQLSKGDLIIGFSGSGNSKNLLKAFQYGKKSGAICIGLTGKSGGKMKKFCNVCIMTPTNDMLQIESLHVVLCHCIISSIRKIGKPLFTYE